MLKKLLIVLLLVVIAAGAGLYGIARRLNAEYRGYQAAEVFVDVPQGSSVASIADRLAAAGVVRDPLTFRIAARLVGADRRLQAGEYRFAEPATPFSVVDRLARGDVHTRAVTFPEGLTAREMAVIFGKSGLGTAEEFDRASRDGSLAARFDPEARTLEGYLFPDTYRLARTTGAAGTVAAMVDRFDRTFDSSLRSAADARGFSVRETVTLASLIEKETSKPEERALVSAVYHNRLRIGMALQCDPTVIYALMLAGRWNGNIRRGDLQIDSPYNTYRYPGLPPGPIASPGRPSIEAALSPADVPYLYFVSRNDGSHVFATTLAEHNRNVDVYQRGGRTRFPQK
jgi:UPF0755 protein